MFFKKIVAISVLLLFISSISYSQINNYLIGNWFMTQEGKPQLKYKFADTLLQIYMPNSKTPLLAKYKLITTKNGQQMSMTWLGSAIPDTYLYKINRISSNVVELQSFEITQYNKEKKLWETLKVKNTISRLTKAN
jgi:hypothetical protein